MLPPPTTTTPPPTPPTTTRRRTPPTATAQPPQPLPPQVAVMKRCSAVGMTAALVLYVAFGCALYASMGADVPPRWDRAQWSEFGVEPQLLAAAALLVALTMAPATQFKAQPAFEAMWRAITAGCGWAAAAGRRQRRRARLRGGDGSEADGADPNAPAPASGSISASGKAARRLARAAAQVALRWAYVAAATAVALAMPSPSVLLGLAGAAAFAPLVVAYPIEMQARLSRPSRRGWVLRRGVQALAGMVSAVAAAGLIADAVVGGGG